MDRLASRSPDLSGSAVIPDAIIESMSSRADGPYLLNPLDRLAMNQSPAGGTSLALTTSREATSDLGCSFSSQDLPNPLDRLANGTPPALGHRTNPQAALQPSASETSQLETSLPNGTAEHGAVPGQGSTSLLASDRASESDSGGAAVKDANQAHPMDKLLARIHSLEAVLANEAASASDADDLASPRIDACFSGPSCTPHRICSEDTQPNVVGRLPFNHQQEGWVPSARPTPQIAQNADAWALKKQHDGGSRAVFPPVSLISAAGVQGDQSSLHPAPALLTGLAPPLGKAAMRLRDTVRATFNPPTAVDPHGPAAKPSQSNGCGVFPMQEHADGMGSSPVQIGDIDSAEATMSAGVRTILEGGVHVKQATPPSQGDRPLRDASRETTDQDLENTLQHERMPSAHTIRPSQLQHGTVSSPAAFLGGLSMARGDSTMQTELNEYDELPKAGPFMGSLGFAGAPPADSNPSLQSRQDSLCFDSDGSDSAGYAAREGGPAFQLVQEILAGPFVPMKPGASSSFKMQDPASDDIWQPAPQMMLRPTAHGHVARQGGLASQRAQAILEGGSAPMLPGIPSSQMMPVPASHMVPPPAPDMVLHSAADQKGRQGGVAIQPDASPCIQRGTNFQNIPAPHDQQACSLQQELHLHEAAEMRVHPAVDRSIMHAGSMLLPDASRYIHPGTSLSDPPAQDLPVPPDQAAWKVRQALTSQVASQASALPKFRLSGNLDGRPCFQSVPRDQLLPNPQNGGAPSQSGRENVQASAGYAFPLGPQPLKGTALSLDLIEEHPKLLRQSTPSRSNAAAAGQCPVALHALQAYGSTSEEGPLAGFDGAHTMTEQQEASGYPAESETSASSYQASGILTERKHSQAAGSVALSHSQSGSMSDTHEAPPALGQAPKPGQLLNCVSTTGLHLIKTAASTAVTTRQDPAASEMSRDMLANAAREQSWTQNQADADEIATVRYTASHFEPQIKLHAAHSQLAIETLGPLSSAAEDIGLHLEAPQSLGDASRTNSSIILVPPECQPVSQAASDDSHPDSIPQQNPIDEEMHGLPADSDSQLASMQSPWEAPAQVASANGQPVLMSGSSGQSGPSELASAIGPDSLSDRGLEGLSSQHLPPSHAVQTSSESGSQLSFHQDFYQQPYTDDSSVDASGVGNAAPGLRDAVRWSQRSTPPPGAMQTTIFADKHADGNLQEPPDCVEGEDTIPISHQQQSQHVSLQTYANSCVRAVTIRKLA